MKQGEKFSDARVRAIKLALMRGTHPRAIARAEECNLNTIIRIRDGDTYAHVKVAGESTLRPELVVGEYVPEGEQLAQRGPTQVPTMTQAEVDALEQELLEHQAAVNEGRIARVAHLPGKKPLPERPEGTSDKIWAVVVDQHNRSNGNA